MDPGEAEGSGREYLERWPRDRVILGSIHPYRLPPARHSGSVTCLGQWEPQISLGSALFDFKPRPSVGAFRPRRAPSYPPLWWAIVQGITPPLSYNTVPYSRIRPGNEN